MNKTGKIILSVAAVTAMAVAAGFVLFKSGKFHKMMKDWQDKNPKFDINERFRLIAKALDRDIKNTSRRTSERYHNKNQKKYESLDWDSEVMPRSMIDNN